MKQYLLFLFSLIMSISLLSQELIGNVYDNNAPIPFANILIENDSYSTVVSTNLKGVFKASGLKYGEVNITVSRLGRETRTLVYNVENEINRVDVLMGEEIYDLDEIVITGTKTFKRRTKSPVIVSILDNKKIRKSSDL